MGFLYLTAVLFVLIAYFCQLIMGFCFQCIYYALILSYQFAYFLLIFFHYFLCLFLMSLLQTANTLIHLTLMFSNK